MANKKTSVGKLIYPNQKDALIRMTNTSSAKPIGIFGLGELGRKLAAQILSAGLEVIAYDPNVQSAATLFESAVNPQLDVNDLEVNRLTLASQPEDVIRQTDVVHWVVPSAKLAELPPIMPEQFAVLHDSVMGSSLAAIETRPETNQFCIAHCLMNEAGRVLLSSEHGDHDMISEHFRAIGLSPKLITVQEHDQMIARTQGVFALLISLGLAEELEQRSDEGDLTPSATELKKAVLHRQSKWTKSTIDSILTNSELVKFVDELRQVLTK